LHLSGHYKLEESNYKIGECIGKGAFGSVYKCESKDGASFAVKQFSKTDTQSKRSFYTEFQTLKNLEHLNVVHFIGYFEKDSYIYILMNLMDGSLKGKMRDRKESGATWWNERELKEFMLQIIEGLIYLKKRSSQS